MKGSVRHLLVTIAFMIALLSVCAAGGTGRAYAENGYGSSDPVTKDIVQEDPELISPSEEVVLGDIKVELYGGESVVPLHGTANSDNGYLDTLYNYNVQDGIPVSLLAIKSCYNTETQLTDQYFDVDSIYTTNLQVHITEKADNTTYIVTEDTTLTIDGNVFSIAGTPTVNDSGEWTCTFRCKTIRPKYIRVGNKILGCTNKDNLEGDYDVFGDGTVLYDISGNVLKLNNATLQFSREIAELSSEYGDLDSRPSFIASRGSDLNIILTGQNKFIPAGEVVTDCSQISGIRHYVDPDNESFSTVITGDGELSISFDGNDTSANAAPIGFDVSDLMIKDHAKLSLDFKNCNTYYALQIMKGPDSGILESAEVSITDDGGCKGSDAFGIIHGGGTFRIGGSSKTTIDISGANALWASDNLEISDNAMILLKAGNYALGVDNDIYFSDYKAKIFVNTEASEEGRSEWDGESDLSYKYKYICSACATHVYGSWIVDQEATCTNAGSRHRVCENCGNVETEEIPAAHKWNSEYTIDKPATSSAAGSKSIHCSVCGAVKEGSSVSIPQLAPLEKQDLKAVSISKPKAGKKKVTVKWKKVSRKNQKKIGGIEIQVATDSKFTKIVKSTTAKKSKASKTIKGLKSRKTYWVRIRAYKNAADGKHVSAWKTKKVKIK